MGEVVPARTSPTLPPHPLALCCNYPVSKCRSASIVATSTVRVNLAEGGQNNKNKDYTLSKTATMLQLTISKNVLYPGLYHLLTTDADYPTL